MQRTIRHWGTLVRSENKERHNKSFLGTHGGIGTKLHRGLARTNDCPVLSLGRCRDIFAAVAASRNGFSGEGHRPAIGELQPTAPPIEFRFRSSCLAGSHAVRSALPAKRVSYEVVSSRASSLLAQDGVA